MEWASLYMLLFLIPAAVAAVFGFIRKRPAIRFSTLAIHRNLRERGNRARLWWLPDSLLSAAVALSVLALAGPRKGIEVVHRETEGVDIALCLDVSGSMEERDLDGNRTRLSVVKEVVTDFAEKRTEDNLALVVFAKRAYRVVPLTPDKELLNRYLQEVDIGIVNPEATAIGDALARAVDVLRSGKARSKVVILLTDGSNNAGDTPPLTAAEAARSLGVKVYTVGAGSPAPHIRRRYPMDEELLTDIAQKTRGQYFRAADRQGLIRAYREIDRLEKTRLEKVVFRRYREFFPALLGAATACLVLAVVLAETWMGRLPA